MDSDTESLNHLPLTVAIEDRDSQGQVDTPDPNDSEVPSTHSLYLDPELTLDPCPG